MMKGEIKRLLSRAEESINAAQLLLDQQLAFSKHSAVIAAFGEHFAKTDKLNPEFHRYLRDAFDQRVVGDYDVLSDISKETARTT